MKSERLEKFEKSELIGFILKKDQMIEGLTKRQEGLEYVGRVFIKDRFYALYIREDKND
jgi:hypothetical protein